MDIPEDYILAEGPEGLEKVLIELLEKTKKDPTFATEEHYILYQLASQKSLIKVDTKQQPFVFWYCDLMGRPITIVAKEKISDFLWNQWGREQYLKDKAGG